MKQVWLVTYVDNNDGQRWNDGPYASLEAIENYYGVTFDHLSPEYTVMVFEPTKNKISSGKYYEAELWNVEGS